MKYQIVAEEGRAKSAHMETVHGVIETPVFMNVGTVGAIKGAVSTMDLREIGCQVELSNTYHLHVRTGDRLIREFGGLHKFMNWDRPILTDSGGFQVFSLTSLRKIREEGVWFSSHIDGHKIFMGPEESMQIQSNLGSTIAMAFDECPPALADRSYIEQSVARTTRWLRRCKAEMERLGIGRVVRTAAELDKWFAPLTANPMRLEQIRQNALAYTRRNVGATKEIMHIISDGQP